MDSIREIQEAFEHALLVPLFQPVFDNAGDLAVAQMAQLIAVNGGHLTRCIRYDTSKPVHERYDVHPSAGALRLMSFVKLGCCFGVCYPMEWSIWALRAYQAAYQRAAAVAPQGFHRSDTLPTTREILVLHRLYRLLPEPLFASQAKIHLRRVAEETDQLIRTLLWGLGDEPDETVHRDLSSKSVEPEEIRSIGQKYLDCWHLVEEACGYDWFRVDE